MKDKVNAGTAAIIIGLGLVVVVLMGYMFLGNRYGTPPPIPMAPGGGGGAPPQLALPGSGSTASPTGSLNPTLPGGMGGQMMPGGGGGMTAPPTTR